MFCAVVAFFVFLHVSESAIVFGTGAPASCAGQSLVTTVINAADGETITFNCGANPVTIQLLQQLSVHKTLTLDGGGLITLDAQQYSRHFELAQTSMC